MTEQEKQLIKQAVEAFGDWRRFPTQPKMKTLIEKMDELRKASGEEGC